MISLGIDTSNYTTSVALYNGETFRTKRKILDVKMGMRGIRQSEGVFIHNRELPNMLGEILDGVKVDIVGVSVSPRNAEGSYMPVFTVGHGYAKAITSALGINLYEFSHQDGHLMAGIYSAGCFQLLDKPFLAVHLSGGTTEILSIKYNGLRFDEEIIGGTLDISVGQLIDRIGVKMGMKFPCGKELENLALSCNEIKRLPFSIKDTYFNLSGVETKLMNEITAPNPSVAKTVFSYVTELLIKTISNAMKKTFIKDVLVVGGVASNSIIRNGLKECFKDRIFFATKELSSDNAVGCSVLAYLAERK